MKQTILFVHGMFQNAKSWDQWVQHFTKRGYECLAPSWPCHEGNPSTLRSSPPEDLGTLRLETAIRRYSDLIRSEGLRPIVIGHSVGGLIAQKLVESQLVTSAIAVCSVAPNRMLAMDWGFLRNCIEIANPLLGNSIIEMTPEGFHKNFANVMSREDSDAAFKQTATHDSRNVLRDCMRTTGKIDLLKPHAPLLFVAAEKDEIIPPQLVQRNAHGYVDRASVAAYKMFTNRGHFICGEPGWDEVATYCADWIESSAVENAFRQFAKV